MSVVVMKFGGTSVGSAERIRQSAALVAEAARSQGIVVVVSALAGVTDLIIQSVQAAVAGAREDMERHLDTVASRHRNVLRDLFGDAPGDAASAEAVETCEAVLGQLRDFCSALLLLRSSTAQMLDVALPMGEKISAAIFAAALQRQGTPARSVDSSRLLITDERFGDAWPDMEATGRRCREVLPAMMAERCVPVVTGFGGATAKGQPTTLGRGGSDSSATIIGAALGVDEIWIWTDVDGVLTADPRICPAALTLPEITYAEAIELSYYGAKVIHHKAIGFVAGSGIPVWIKNSFQPRVAGTRIAPVLRGEWRQAVKAVTAVTEATLVTLTTRQDVHFAEVFGRLFLRLGHENVDVLFSTQSSSENSLGLVLRQQEAERVIAAIQRLFRMELKHGTLHPISVLREVAVIAVMGESMRGVAGILGRLFSAVASRQLSVIAVAQGASEINICFAVESRRAAEAVRAVHDEFLSSPAAQSRWVDRA
jgi:aspartokinase/homoserine dehydrogenase 1